MAEAIGIALGVIPLIGLAYKSYQSIAASLEAFQNCPRDLRRTKQQLEVQRHAFKNQCWLLLDLALGEDSVRLLKADPFVADWSEEINAEFQRNLATSYHCCLMIIQDVRGYLKELENELEGLVPLLEDSTEQSLGDSVRAFRKKVSHVNNRKTHERICRDLRRSNKDLRGFRKDLQELQNPCKPASKPAEHGLLELRRGGDWSAACKTRRHSSALFLSLQKAWSCKKNPHDHLGHSMRLFLSPTRGKANIPAAESTNMQLSLAVVGQRLTQGKMVSTAFQLSVAVQSLWSEGILFNPPAPNQLRQVCGVEEERSSKKIKTGPFSEAVSRLSVRPETTPLGGQNKPANARPPISDLRSMPDLCSHIGQYCLCDPQPTPRLIGFLDVQDGSERARHRFYRDHFHTQVHMPNDNNVSLSELLSKPNLCNIKPWQRLLLARAVAIIALTYYDTPYLKSFWRLRDISLLLGSLHSFDSVLKTLHLEVGLLSCGLLAPADEDITMEMMPPPQNRYQPSDESARRSGVYDKTLHCLGVALVGIDQSQDFDPCDPREVELVRSLGADTDFGPVYDSVVAECLDFQYRPTKPGMQKAAFERIVGPLQSILAAFGVVVED